MIIRHEQGWNLYVKGALTATKEKENRTLGGYVPASLNSEEGEPDSGPEFVDDSGEEFDDYEEENNNSEVVFESDQYEQRDEFSPQDKGYQIGQEDEDDEEQVVIQGTVQTQDEDEEELVGSDVWIEKQIKDTNEDADGTTRTLEIDNIGNSEQHEVKDQFVDEHTETSLLSPNKAGELHTTGVVGNHIGETQAV